MRLSPPLSTLLVLTLLTGCDRREATNDLGQEADRQAVMAAYDGILAAAESGDPQGYVGWLTDDAVMMYSGQPAVVGREAIRSFIDDFFANNTFQFDPWQSEEIQVDGSLAFHRYSGVATIAPKNGGEAIELDRKYIDILRKEGGSWKISHHIFNTNK